MKCNLMILACMAMMSLLFVAGVAAADNVTPNATTVATPATQEKEGGSISFDTIPEDATIWLDNVQIGTSPFTYFTEKSDTYIIRVQKKGYQDYTGTVTVNNGERVRFSARLDPLPSDLSQPTVTTVPVTTATTIRKSTISIPTPWPTTTQASPLEPGAGIVAITVFAFFVTQRR